MRLRKPIVGAFFVVAFALNPAFVTGCGVGKLADPYQFDENQAVALLESAQKQGPYRITDNGATYEVSFTVEQNRGGDSHSSLEPALTRTAHACGKRTFLRSAGACLDTTEVPIAGKVTVKRIGPIAATYLEDAPTTGVFRIIGKTLEQASVELDVGKQRVEIATADAKTFHITDLWLAPDTKVHAP